MYEIHLTVAAMATSAWQAFEQRVTSLGGKAMVIELARGDIPLQPMLTLGKAGKLDEVIRFAQALSHELSQSGYPVLRCKIEQDANAGLEASHHYVEWHGRVEVLEADRSRLAGICQQHGGHLSQNAIRGSNKRYVTVRETDDFRQLASRVAGLRAAMSEQGWEVGKQQWERVVYDSNLALDSGWLEQAK
jgi:hypothetical protein